MSECRNLVRSVPSGVPGLDTVLGGGLPEYSLKLPRHNGLTGSEAVVLGALTSIGRVSVPSLGKYLGMEGGQLGRALDRIESLGYGISEATNGDHRRYAPLPQPMP